MKRIVLFALFVALVLPLASQDFVTEVRHWQQVQRSILASDKPEQLSPIKFEHYLDALRSEAECHYMLDNYESLFQCAERYWELLEKRIDLEEEVIDNLTSYGYKMYGSYYYGQSEDDSAFYYAAQLYSLALENADPYDYRHLCVLHREMAQLYYRKAVQRDDTTLLRLTYQELLQASDALAHAAAPFNNDTLRATLLSERAITLARLAEIRNDSLMSPKMLKAAIDTTDMALRLFPAGTDMRHELLRKKAKILMLSAECAISLSHNDIEGIQVSKLIADADNIYRQYFNRQKKQLPITLRQLSTLGSTPAQVRQMREQHWLTMRRLLTDCSRLEGHDPVLLYDVALFSKMLLQELPTDKKQLPKTPTWTDVQRKLGKGDCAIEFVTYEKYGRQHLAALTLHNSGLPTFVYLYPIDEMLATMLSGYTLDEALSINDGALKDLIYSDTILPRQVWTPQLLEAIDTARTERIFFAPDAFLHRLAIEYLWPGAKVPKLYRVTSTRRLADSRSTRSATSPMLLVGHIDYDHPTTSPTIPQQTNDTLAYTFFKTVKFKFDSLPWTQNEIDSIKALVPDVQTTHILTDTAANEYAFRRKAPGNKIIHIATHGIYEALLSPETDLKPREADIAMSLSAIAFAGINRLDTEPSPFDGILSANEVSQLPLNDVKLVVLSACQSAEGMLTDDGLFGLQRGLKNAGVKALIVSLWSVDDQATAMLMSLLYKYMQQYDIHTAFDLARQELIQQQTTRMRFDSRRLSMTLSTEPQFTPRHYDAFIMIDVL
jgi:CHAT domain-containing protein